MSKLKKGIGRENYIIGEIPDMWRTAVKIQLFQGGTARLPKKTRTFNIYFDVWEDAVKIVEQALVKAFGKKGGEEK